MLKKEDFVFCVGYQGDTALVDSRAKKKYGKLTTVQLLEKGLYKAAFSSAVYEQNEQDMSLVIEAYNKAAGSQIKHPDEMKRLFGISDVSEAISKVIAL